MVLARLHGDDWLMPNLMYGAGLRLQECVELGVQDIDFQRNQVQVRDGKGRKDRVTMLPRRLKEPLQRHLEEIRRGDVFMIDLDPTRGHEIQKMRPCVVVSPDDLNAHLQTFIVAPLTTGKSSYPFRIACTFQGKAGHVVLDQTRTVDQERLVRRIGALSPVALNRCLATLQEMFAPWLQKRQPNQRMHLTPASVTALASPPSHPGRPR